MSWFTATMVAWGAAALAHGFIRHLRPTLNTVGLFCLLGGIAGAGLLSHLGQVFGLCLPVMLAAGVLYAFLCELYLFALTFVLGSVSVWLLLLHLDPRLAGPAAVETTAGFAAMTSQRLDRMKQTGLLEFTGGGYCLTPKGRMLLRGAQACRRFFGHREQPMT